MRYIVIIIALAIAVSVAGCDWRAINYGVEKMDHGYIPESGPRLYHMGTMDLENWHFDGKNYDYNTVELSRFPEVLDIVLHDERAFDGPFGKDAESYTDLQRLAMYNNYYFPNRWYEGGFAPVEDSDDVGKPAFDGHLAL
jgi:hypothetical protein